MTNLMDASRDPEASVLGASLCECIRGRWPQQPLDLHFGAEWLRARFAALLEQSHTGTIERHPTPPRLHVLARDGSYRCDAKAPARTAAILFNSGTCVGLEDFESVSLEAQRALEELAATAGVPFSHAHCLAFLSPTGAGVPQHFDDKEVLVIQIKGQKEWLLWENQTILNPLCTFSPYARSPDESALPYSDKAPQKLDAASATRVVMKPGSVLVLPRGHWHATRALSQSLSLSFALTTPTRADLFLNEIRRVLHESPYWRAPTLGAWTPSVGGEVRPHLELQAAALSCSSALTQLVLAQRCFERVAPLPDQTTMETNAP